MNEEKRLQVRASRMYSWLRRASDVMDRYYLDAALGFAIPAGIGDAISGMLALGHAYFSARVVKSVPLTLAILNNALRDVLLGMIPFHVGDVIDIFHKANRQNMGLVDGFIDGNEDIIHTVNRKAWQAALLIVVFVAAIIAMAWLLVWLTKTLGTVLFS
jgi:hypothetical protein